MKRSYTNIFLVYIYKQHMPCYKMSLTFGTEHINAVHTTFNSFWTFLFHRRSRHTERSWQSCNSSLLVTSSHVVITTTLPIRISSQTKRPKIINELAPRRWNSAKHEDSFCNFHLYTQIKLHTCVRVCQVQNLPAQLTCLNQLNGSHIAMLSMFVKCK